MDEIKFNCPHCGQSLVVNFTSAGATVACPHCGQAMLVPQLARSAAQAGMPKQFKSAWFIAGVGIFALCAAGIMLWQAHRQSATQIKPSVAQLPHEAGNESAATPGTDSPEPLQELETSDNEESSVPQTEAEWSAFGNQLLDLFRAGDFSTIVHRADSIGRTVILNSRGHYLPKACIANALMREEQYHESLDFFEAALKLSLRNLDNYCRSVRLSGEFDRGLAFLQELKEIDPNNSKAIDASVSDLTFFSAVARGDDKYLAGDKRGALVLYQQARQEYASRLAVKMTPEQQSAFVSQFTNQWYEYTYGHEYDAPYGASLKKYLLPTFLKTKIQLCKYSGDAFVQEPAVLQVAILIIHNTDFPYVISNKTLVEHCVLDNSGWEHRREAWVFASDAVEMYSGGKIKINTTYIDLPGVTVARVDDAVYKGLFHARHLAPSGLVPSQSSLYENLANKYDIIIFAWNGGAGALAYGGGPVRLPGISGPLPARGCVRRMPSDSLSSLHEFLHNLEGRAFHDRVHGPLQPPWNVQAAQYHLTDEIDWYAHLLSEIKNPESAKYLRP